MKHVHPGKRTIGVFLRCLLTALFILHTTPVLASLMPAFQRLIPLAGRLTTPTAVTLDSSGRIYVAEANGNRVRVFSQSGNLLRTFTAPGRPISLAVDGEGRIYLGAGDQGRVDVYAPSFAYLFSLGQGNDEFGQPNDIDIDTSGLIYVVDKTRSAIRVYNPDGTYNTTIGQPGSDNGQFHHPVSLAMDALSNELVVLDLQQVQDATGMIDGARIQFLEMNGAFKRGSSKFGYDRDKGQLVIPKDVAVDGQSRVYVTDSRLQKVMVYDHNGVFLGMIDDARQPFLTPLSSALAGSNKLYVASLRGEQVEVYGIDSYIEMGVSPAGLSFEELQGAPSGATQSIVINNTGNSTFTWTASSTEPWLVLPVTRDSIPAASLSAVEVGVNIDNLDPGQYQGSVTISAGTAAAETVAVNLTVLPNARLSVSPTSLTFVATVGTTPAAQTLAIENAGSGPLNWNANVDQSWLTLDATSGAAPSSLKVYADAISMIAGSYSGTITVSKQGDLPEMQTIPVSLTLQDPSGLPLIPPPVINPGDKTHHLKWETNRVLPGKELNGVWGMSASDLFAVGSGGAILHYNGRKWSRMESGVGQILYGVWGSSASEVYAVGENGVVLHYDGNGWTPLPAVVPETLRDTWGSSADDVYAVSRNGSILESFSAARSTGVALRGVWGGSDSDIFVVGENGAILHFDGSLWSAMDSATTHWLNGIWGSSGSDVFAVGEGGAIVHFDGTSWRSMDSGTNVTLRSVWGSSATEVFAVGENGLILYYNGSGWYSVPTAVSERLNGVWVSAGSDVFAVGENGAVVMGKGKFPWLQQCTQNDLLNKPTTRRE